MLCLSKKTEYALIALAYMARRGERVSSAREIAEAHDLPLPLLMKILKCMQHHEMLHSTRGVRGGYRLVADLGETTLFDLVAMMECPDRPGADCGCMDRAAAPAARARLARSEPSTGPALVLQERLVGFLQNMTLSDLVKPGPRTERQIAGRRTPNWRIEHAHSAD